MTEHAPQHRPQSAGKLPHTEAKPAVTIGSVPADTAQVLALQRLIGNRAVTKRFSAAPPLVQRTLSDDLNGIMDHAGLNANPYAQLRTRIELFIQNKPQTPNALQEQQQAYQALRGRIQQSADIQPAEKTILLGLLLEGSLRWENTNDMEKVQNNFARFFLHDDDEANINDDLANGSLNCWETVLFLCYEAGIMTRKQVYDLHATVPFKSNYAVWQFLGYGRSVGDYNKNNANIINAQPGQIVFYSTDFRKEQVGHVGLALGGNEMLSLWNEPNGITAIQKVPIGSVIGNMIVSIANPPWMNGTTTVDAMTEAHQDAQESAEELVETTIVSMFEDLRKDTEGEILKNPPQKEEELIELREFVRKDLWDQWAKLGDFYRYKAWNAVRKAFPQYAEKKKKKEQNSALDLILKVVLPRVEEFYHEEVTYNSRNWIETKSPKELIDLIFRVNEDDLVDKATPAVKQAELAYAEYEKFNL